MITETDEGVAVSCDDCSNEVILSFRNRERIRKWLADHNWAIFATFSGYQYRCPCCVQEKSKAQTAPLRLPVPPR